MIVKCDAKWMLPIEEYIGRNYPECLYLYLDFKKYGFGVDYVNIWIQLKDERITAVILKYHTGMHVYSRSDEYYVSEIVDLIKETLPDQICGRRDIIESIIADEKMADYDVEFGYIGICSKVEDDKRYNVVKAETDDFKKIVELLYQDEGIGASYDFDELSNQMLQRNQQGFVRNFVIKDAGKVVCHVCTGAEQGDIAIISGVVTDSVARGKGLASCLLSHTCRQLILEGKEVYSVYYTIPATKLHHSVGFKNYCNFGKLFLKKH